MGIAIHSGPRETVSVARSEPDVGCWEMLSARPHPALRDCVIGYVGLKSTLRVARERHLPSGEAALVVNLGRPHNVANPLDQTSAIEFNGVAAMGVHNQPFVTTSDGTKHLLVVRLTPVGAHLLLKVPMALLLNRWVALNEIDRGLTQRIQKRVHQPGGWDDWFEFMDSLIGERLAEPGVVNLGISWAWNRLRRSGGLATIRSIADRFDCSHKRLIAEFREQVGLLPKTVAEVVRFNRALRLLRNDHGIKWAAAAQECGYHDQAHLIREFKSFAGATPNEIRGLMAGFTLRNRP